MFLKGSVINLAKKIISCKESFWLEVCRSLQEMSKMVYLKCNFFQFLTPNLCGLDAGLEAGSR